LPAVATPSIRRLALGDLDDASLRRLVDHGEDMFVERKMEIPSAGLGPTVCSFANTLGGWVLLGIEDKSKEVRGFSFHSSTDVQSHVGQLLRDEADPLPPFVAGEFKLEGKPVVVLRVFESADTPHIVRGTGAIYTRDSAGKRPVSDQRLLLELAQRGHEVLKRASGRGLGRVLAAPPTESETAEVAVVVRASPLTVAPHFADWALSERAADWVTERANRFKDAFGVRDHWAVRYPHELGVRAKWTGRWIHQKPVVCTVQLDSEGVAAVSVVREVTHMELSRISESFIQPALAAVHDSLVRAEAYGRAAWALELARPDRIEFLGAERTIPRRIQIFGETLAVPADEDELEALKARWTNRIARAAGIERWDS
jgi:hypothetical protein